MIRRGRPRRAAPVLLGAMLTLTGCSLPNLTSLPLPGGAAGGSTYEVTVVVPDAATLVVKSAVRADDVPVGEVESISLTPGLKAKIVCKVRSSVHLPANATATISSTSLLGENFVALGSPAKPVGRLRNGAVISSGTSTQPDTEQVLGALSAILNGGSLGQAQVIVRELTTALRGRTGDVRDLLARLQTLVGTLNTHRATVTRALDGLDRLSGTLAQQHTVLAAALADLPAGIKVLADERPALTELLTSVGDLGTVATRVIDASSVNVLADLAQVKPVLAQLKTRGTEIAKSLNYALTFPFGKDALAAFKGDYAGFYAALNLNVDDLAQLVKPVRQPTPAAPTTTSTPSASPTTTASATNPVSGTVGGLTNLLLGVLQP